MKENNLPTAKIEGKYLVRKVIRKFHFWRNGKGFCIRVNEMYEASQMGIKFFKVIEDNGAIHIASFDTIRRLGRPINVAGEKQLSLEEIYFNQEPVESLNESQAPKSMAHLDPQKLPPTVCIFSSLWMSQKLLSSKLGGWLKGDKYEQTLQLTRALNHEVIELEQQMEKRWKGWKKSASDPNDHEIKMEIIDCMHFLIDISQKHFSGPQEFYEFYQSKNAENFKRIERGY